MKILYGINGTGNGHLTESLQIIHRLESENHQVDILLSGRKKNIIIDRQIQVRRGLTFAYNNGKIDFAKTLISNNPVRFIKDTSIDLDNYDRIVSDFEPLTTWAAKRQSRKSIGIAHQYSFKSSKSPRPEIKSWWAEKFLKHFAPVDLAIGLHFFNYDDFIFQPIIRESIMNGHVSNKGHVLVYLPTHDLETITSFATKWDYEFEVFADVRGRIHDRNVTINPLSLQDFTDKLCSCDLLITAGGFETPSEALYLGKKMIVVPIKGHYEQQCNAAALSQMGIRIESELMKIKSLTCNNIDYKWQNPIDLIVDQILD